MDNIFNFGTSFINMIVESYLAWIPEELLLPVGVVFSLIAFYFILRIGKAIIEVAK